MKYTATITCFVDDGTGVLKPEPYKCSGTKTDVIKDIKALMDTKLSKGDKGNICVTIKAET